MKSNLISLVFPALFLSLCATEASPAQTILDLDSMMDIEMDKVETLPDFVTPPAGLYELEVVEAKTEKYLPKKTAEVPNPKESMRIKIIHKVVETLESVELPVKEGSLFSESFQATEDGIKFFKRQALNILNVKDFEGARLKDVMEGLKEARFKAKITIRKTANPAGGEYENVQVRPIHDTPAV
jgi:hypothetical protein